MKRGEQSSEAESRPVRPRARSDPSVAGLVGGLAPEAAHPSYGLVRVPSMELMETIEPTTPTTARTTAGVPKRGSGLSVGRWPEASPSRRSPPPSPPRQPATEPRRRRVRPQHNDGDYEWLRRRLCNGESATCLSLAGNHAVMLTRARVGETIEYTVRDRQQDPDDPGKYHLVAVSEKFAFHVRGVYGDDKGQAVALQPVAEPRKMYIAFRGMRTRVEDPEEDRYSAYDRASFANLEPAYADWLPSTSMRVHAGILDHHFCVWNNGLGAFLGSLAARCSDPRQTRLDEILFLGISMGGALSEMSAFRCVSLFPVLRDKVHILSFGSIPWANAPLALSYDEFFGRRSVQLVLCRRAQGPPPEGSTWWVREPASRWALLRSIFTTPQGERHAAPAVTATAAAAAHGAGGVRARQEAGAERYIVFDPLSAKHDDVFILLPNVLACSRDDNQVDARATALLHHARITKQQLRDFVHTYLPEEHPMMVDYNQLHYGGRYRDVLVSMLRRRQAIEGSRLHSGVKRGVRGPHGANISTDFIGGPGGTSWGRGAPNAAQLQPGAIIVGGQVIVPEVPLTATGMPKASAPSPSRPVPTAMGCMGPPARPSPAAPSPVAPSPVAPSPAAAEQGGFIRRRAGGLMEGIKEGMREVATRSPKLLRRLTGTLPATAASDAAIVHSSTTAPTTAEPSSSAVPHASATSSGPRYPTAASPSNPDAPAASGDTPARKYGVPRYPVPLSTIYPGRRDTPEQHAVATAPAGGTPAQGSGAACAAPAPVGTATPSDKSPCVSVATSASATASERTSPSLARRMFGKQRSPKASPKASPLSWRSTGSGVVRAGSVAGSEMVAQRQSPPDNTEAVAYATQAAMAAQAMELIAAGAAGVAKAAASLASVSSPALSAVSAGQPSPTGGPSPQPSPTAQRTDGERRQRKGSTPTFSLRRGCARAASSQPAALPPVDVGEVSAAVGDSASAGTAAAAAAALANHEEIAADVDQEEASADAQRSPTSADSRTTRSSFLRPGSIRRLLSKGSSSPGSPSRRSRSGDGDGVGSGGASGSSSDASPGMQRVGDMWRSGISASSNLSSPAISPRPSPGGVRKALSVSADGGSVGSPLVSSPSMRAATASMRASDLAASLDGMTVEPLPQAVFEASRRWRRRSGEGASSLAQVETRAAEGGQDSESQDSSSKEPPVMW